MGIAHTVIAFSMLFNELGFGAAIIQKGDVDQQVLSGIFWFSLIASVILTLAAYFGAPLIGLFFKSEDVIPLIQLLSICFLAGTLRIIPASLLRKELEFDKLSKAEFLSNLLAGLIILLLVVKGYGVYSLVYGYIFKEFLINLLIYYYHPWFPSFVFQWSKVRGVLWFGIRATGSKVLGYFHGKADIFIIGRILGEKMLGYYIMAFNLSQMPVEKIAAVVNMVCFPVFSKLKKDLNQLRNYILKITTFTTILTFPLSTIGIILAEDLFTQILTEKWMMSIIPFRILCLIGIIRSVRAIVRQAYIALGEVNFLLKVNALSVFVYPAAFYLGSFYGINGIAIAWICAYPLISLFFMGKIFRILKLKWTDYINAVRTPVLGCVIIAIVIFLLKCINPVQNQLGELLVEIALPLIIYLLFILKSSEGVKIREIVTTFIQNKRAGLSIEHE